MKTRNIFTTYSIILTLIIIAINAALFIVFDLSTLNLLLMLIASPVVLWLFLVIIKPFLIKLLIPQSEKEKAIQKALKQSKKAQEITFKASKKERSLKHIVWHKSPFEASRFFKAVIKPLAIKNPKKTYEFISDKYNNLKD